MQKGFTFIELIAVLVVLSLVSIPLFGLLTQASLSLLRNEQLQTSIQLAQEKAEVLLKLRRKQGFAVLVNSFTSEKLNGALAGYTRETRISSATDSKCPSPMRCKNIDINVLIENQQSAQIKFVLVDY